MKLKTEGISKIFFRNGKNTNYFYAVKKTDFELKEGKITEIIGKSGSGKTTLINMIAGLLQPSEGKVFLENHDFYELDDRTRSVFRNRHFGMIPQGQTGLQSLTVLENVLLPSMMYGKSANKEKKAKELLEMVGIADLCDVYSNELSGGELRRMAIARALINQPEMIIADEPTSDLDDETTGFVLKLLRQYADEGGSVLMVTHEKEAISYADLVFRMEKGILQKMNI